MSYAHTQIALRTIITFLANATAKLIIILRALRFICVFSPRGVYSTNFLQNCTARNHTGLTYSISTLVQLFYTAKTAQNIRPCKDAARDRTSTLAKHNNMPAMWPYNTATDNPGASSGGDRLPDELHLFCSSGRFAPARRPAIQQWSSSGTMLTPLNYFTRYKNPCTRLYSMHNFLYMQTAHTHTHTPRAHAGGGSPLLTSHASS